MTWHQKEIQLPAYSRGCHLVTDQVLGQLDEIARIRVGLFNLFIKHTSAALALNENADPTVRHDVEAHLTYMVPADMSHYRHTYEGPDDMPAHIKTILVGSSLTVPIRDGRLNLGTWQGIYLCEFRDRARSRRLVATLMGE
jgi:secondary thiamine-phosphate synthase enzyme